MKDIMAQKEREEREMKMIDRELKEEKQRDVEHIAMAGDNTINRFPLQLFEPEYIARHGSYRPTISEFWDKKRLRYITESEQFELPDIIVLIFGGNDIAFLQTPEYKRPPPTTNRRKGYYGGNRTHHIQTKNTRKHNQHNS